MAASCEGANFERGLLPELSQTNVFCIVLKIYTSHLFSIERECSDVRSFTLFSVDGKRIWITAKKKKKERWKKFRKFQRRQTKLLKIILDLTIQTLILPR